jgi:hypothetical protein
MPGFDFVRWMKSIESKISFILERLNNVLANTGLSIPSPGVTQVDGSLNVVGTENVSGNLNVSGNETVSGNLTVSGALVLPNASVNNAWLTNPLSPTRLHSDANNYTVGTAWSTIATAVTTVPTGYTQALILSMAVGASAQNSTAASDFLYASGRVNTGSLGGYSLGSADVPAGKYGLTFDFQTGLLPGLTAGSTLTFTAQVSTAFGSWAANTGNVANLDVALLWLR